ncbi:hypothetical protein ACFX2K_022694 [Malus domestica]
MQSQSFRKSRAVCRSVDSRYQRSICFSRHVNACHMQTQLCGNHEQFVEAPIPDIEEALAFPDVSTPVTYRLSFAEITGSLSKRRFQISEKHLLFQTCQRLSHVDSALQKLRAICRRSLVK